MVTKIRRSKTPVLVQALVLFGILLLSSSFSTFDPQQQADLLQQQIKRYAQIEANGGWQKIRLGKTRYTKGDSGATIVQVKKRLAATGDFTGQDSSELYTDALESAVKRVQRRFGFPENGVIEAALVLALNVPVEERLTQLYSNLERLHTQKQREAVNSIVVNIPEYRLHVYENGREVLTLNAIVGKETHKTPTFDDELTQIVFSPYWNVPPSIVQNEILPAMRRSRHYLSRHGYEITGHENGLPTIRQRPGGGNSLGRVKFLFPNSYAVYFHDTPAKTLFKNRIRAYSHGCVRLEEPEKLAAYLLRNNSSWTAEKINSAMHAGHEQWVKLPAPIPVSITYYTAWVDDEGLLNFRDDIYGFDSTMPVAGNF